MFQKCFVDLGGSVPNFNKNNQTCYIKDMLPEFILIYTHVLLNNRNM